MRILKFFFNDDFYQNNFLCNVFYNKQKDKVFIRKEEQKKEHNDFLNDFICFLVDKIYSNFDKEDLVFCEIQRCSNNQILNIELSCKDPNKYVPFKIKNTSFEIPENVKKDDFLNMISKSFLFDSYYKKSNSNDVFYDHLTFVLLETKEDNLYKLKEILKRDIKSLYIKNGFLSVNFNSGENKQGFLYKCLSNDEILSIIKEHDFSFINNEYFTKS
jgi:hypothetical protein